MESSTSFSPYRSDGKLYGFVCIVTGATQAVGRACVRELAHHGAACIYACDRSDDEDYDSLVDAIKKEFPNTKVIPYSYDTTAETATLVLIDDVLNSWGRLDIWLCSSGILGPASIQELTPQSLQQVFETNALSPFLALKYAPPAMSKTCTKGEYPNAAAKDQPYGSIIVISSVASTYGGCWGPGFTMGSHAALGVVRSGVAVLKGVAPGVRINCISPGQVDVGVSLEEYKSKGMMHNNGTPPASLQSKEVQKETIGLERPGLPEEVAKVAGFLASGFSSYVTGFCNFGCELGIARVGIQVSIDEDALTVIQDVGTLEDIGTITEFTIRRNTPLAS
ncbi:hypothetical protein ABW19_dt0209139 [Dactylella cylindrospora]|nr:hypothetical protein ABW19_dt0209139 [Dactylella cylindrospora]